MHQQAEAKAKKPENLGIGTRDIDDQDQPTPLGFNIQGASSFIREPKDIQEFPSSRNLALASSNQNIGSSFKNPTSPSNGLHKNDLTFEKQKVTKDEDEQDPSKSKNQQWTEQTQTACNKETTAQVQSSNP